MRHYLLLMAGLMLSGTGCLAEPVRKSATSNPEISVGLLFEYDGCKVYRFVDDRVHYFVRCGRESTVAVEGHVGVYGKIVRHYDLETPQIPTDRADAAVVQP